MVTFGLSEGWKRPPSSTHEGTRVHLKDFDLAGGRVEVLRVLSSVSQGEGVNLDPEGNALLSTVLPGSELSADAVHLEQQTGKETPRK